MLGGENRLASGMMANPADDELEHAVARPPSRPRHSRVRRFHEERRPKLLGDLPCQNAVVRLPLLANIDAAAGKLPEAGVGFADEQRTAVADDERFQADFESLDGARHEP